ncbi:hypothetical protein ENBRE01_2273 [Enteropsectra breve]|nr:hypothetical protein ENBRE01_2273 [Enteropsectra breve]
MNGRTRFPLSLPASSETTARGTGLGAQRGKKTLLSLTLASAGGRGAHVARWEAARVKDHWRAGARPHFGTRAGGEFGWGGTAARPQRSCPEAGSAGRETPRRAQGQKPAGAAGARGRAGKPGPSDPAGARPRTRGWRKSYHRDNWLVAAKRPQRRRFLILRCRLFLALRCTRRKAWDCSPTSRERELGLDRRETG